MTENKEHTDNKVSNNKVSPVNDNPTPKTDAVAAAPAEPHTFKERIDATRKTRWWRFGIVAFIYLLWVVWMNNYWFLLGLPLLFDIYITGYIPFTWWKKSKSAITRSVMSWVDAIVYALVLVYFVFAFIGQNYQIPSSSLEKTLLTGDYLWVNKMVYGPRVPITPIHFPLAHNTMPFVGGDSYASWPEVKYRRLPGLRDVERNDIVVFNFPAGDTVATKYEEDPMYYDLLVKTYGWGEVNTNTEKFGKVKYRPVDRRTNFVKRVVGLPGERLAIHDDVIYINGKAQPQPENAQWQYVAALSRPLTDEQIKEYDINQSDIQSPNGVNAEVMEYLRASLPGSRPTDAIVVIPLTNKMLRELKASGQITSAVRATHLEALQPGTLNLFPEIAAANWTTAEYGGANGILIPKKGLKVPMNATTWDLYKRVIRNYERHHDAYLKGNTVYMDGKPIKDYTFEMDYYFMMGDNRDMSQDSRFWGFVPEDHIIGVPMFILASFDREHSLFDGKIRWNRFFRSANPDK